MKSFLRFAQVFSSQIERVENISVDASSVAVGVAISAFFGLLLTAWPWFSLRCNPDVLLVLLTPGP